jgi:hypothetical protein
VPFTEPSATTIVSASSCDTCGEPAGIAAELLVEGRGKLRYQPDRAQLLVVLQVAHLGKGFGADQCAKAHRVGRIEELPRLVTRQERIDLLLRGYVDAFVRMGQDEAVHADHHRTGQLFRQPERLDVQVQRFLIGFGEQLDPAGVAHRHAVGMVVPDIDGAPIARLPMVITIGNPSPAAL